MIYAPCLLQACFENSPDEARLERPPVPLRAKRASCWQRSASNRIRRHAPYDASTQVPSYIRSARSRCWYSMTTRRYSTLVSSRSISIMQPRHELIPEIRAIALGSTLGSVSGRLHGWRSLDSHRKSADRPNTRWRVDRAQPAVDRALHRCQKNSATRWCCGDVFNCRSRYGLLHRFIDSAAGSGWRRSYPNLAKLTEAFAAGVLQGYGSAGKRRPHVISGESCPRTFGLARFPVSFWAASMMPPPRKTRLSDHDRLARRDSPLRVAKSIVQRSALSSATCTVVFLAIASPGPRIPSGIAAAFR